MLLNACYSNLHHCDLRIMIFMFVDLSLRYEYCSLFPRIRRDSAFLRTKDCKQIMKEKGKQ